jgi:hypothetical protein
MQRPASRKERLFAGWASVGIGLFGLVMMSLRPEHLRVPAWVGLPAMSTFVWGGGAVLLGEHEATKGLAGWAALLAVLGLFVPAAWIAFGSGPRECAATLGIFSTRAVDWVCRGAFGVGALLVALLFVLMARQVATKR